MIYFFQAGLKRSFGKFQVILKFNDKSMNKNMGSTDRAIRLSLAAVLVLLYFFDFVSGSLGIAALGVAVVLLLTSLVSFCPLYFLLGLTTCKTKTIK